MVNFFKNFGKGILYVLVLPFLLVGMAIYGVIALFVFLFLCIKGLILFFTGRSLYEDLPEDIEAKKRLASFNHPNPQPEATNNNSGATIINTTPIISSEEQSTDPFYVPEYLKEEDTVEEEPKQVVEEPQVEKQPAPVVEEEKTVEEPVDDVITVEKTHQNPTIIEINDDDNDDDDTGVNIDFD